MTTHTTPTSGAADLPEALRLADQLDLYATGDEHQRTAERAAAELRRLHALTAQAISAEPAGAGYAEPMTELEIAEQFDFLGGLIDDYTFNMVIGAAKRIQANALRASQGAIEPAGAGLPIESAPKDGTLLRLQVMFESGSLEDDNSKPIWTTGFNALRLTGLDEWQFVGWNWVHDCFCDGTGTPIGWLPMELASHGQAPAQPRHSKEYLAAKYSAAALAQEAQQAPAEATTCPECDRKVIDGVVKCPLGRACAVGRMPTPQVADTGAEQGAAGVPSDGQKDRLLAALERAAAAESELRLLVDECDNDCIPGWEERMSERVANANRLLAATTTAQGAAIAAGADRVIAVLDAMLEANTTHEYQSAADDAKDLIDQLRASHGQAPAQQADPSITLDFKQASELLEMFGGESGLMTLQRGGAECHSGPGLYAWYSDVPEEGAEFLGTEPDYDATPQAADTAPAQGAAVPAVMFGNEDHVLVPRGLIGAACSIIARERKNSSKTLAELRRYTVGDLSQAQGAGIALGWNRKLSDRLERELGALMLECPPAIVSNISHLVRNECEALYTSLATLKRMYAAARDRYEALEAAAPQPAPPADSQKAPAPSDEAIFAAARNWGEVKQYHRTDGKGTEYRIVFNVHQRAAHFARELLAARTPADSVLEDAARWNAWAEAMVEGYNAPDLNPSLIIALSAAVGEAEIPMTREQLNAWTDAARAAQKEVP